MGNINEKPDFSDVQKFAGFSVSELLPIADENKDPPVNPPVFWDSHQVQICPTFLYYPWNFSSSVPSGYLV